MTSSSLSLEASFDVVQRGSEAQTGEVHAGGFNEVDIGHIGGAWTNLDKQTLE